MKSVYKNILLIISLVISTSCVDIERYEDGRISYDEIFQNDKKTAGYLNRCYSYLEAFGTQYPGSTM